MPNATETITTFCRLLWDAGGVLFSGDCPNGFPALSRRRLRASIEKHVPDLLSYFDSFCTMPIDTRGPDGAFHQVLDGVMQGSALACLGELGETCGEEGVACGNGACGVPGWWTLSA